MPKKYNIGSRNLAFGHMVACAIRDRLQFLEAITPQFSDIDEETAVLIKETNGEIADFKRLSKTK